jgi:hypothetical protein
MVCSLFCEDLYASVQPQRFYFTSQFPIPRPSPSIDPLYSSLLTPPFALVQAPLYWLLHASEGVLCFRRAISRISTVHLG